MCEYCEGEEFLYEQHYPDTEIYSVKIKDSKLIISDVGARDLKIKINYCPMCSRKLK